MSPSRRWTGLGTVSPPPGPPVLPAGVGAAKGEASDFPEQRQDPRAPLEHSWALRPLGPLDRLRDSVASVSCRVRHASFRVECFLEPCSDVVPPPLATWGHALGPVDA